MTTDKDKLDKIMEMIVMMNGDGGHHKQYLIDQIVRVIQGDNYENWRREFEYADGEGGFYPEKIFEWDEGIP